MRLIDLKRLRRYRALEFRQPVTQGKYSAMRSLYNAMRNRLSLVLYVGEDLPAQLVT